MAQSPLWTCYVIAARSAPDHLRRDVSDHGQADITDPALPVQEARDERGRNAHQRDRRDQTEDQHRGMFPRRPRHRQHIVERHRDVGHDDLPHGLGKCLDGRGPGNDAVRIQIAAHQRFACILLRLGRRAQLPQHLPADPQQQNASGERQPDDLQQLRGRDCEQDAHDGCRQHAEQHRARALKSRQSRGSKADDDGVVASQDQIDHDDLKKRGIGVG
jgi:hypothetical protein